MVKLLLVVSVSVGSYVVCVIFSLSDVVLVCCVVVNMFGCWVSSVDGSLVGIFGICMGMVFVLMLNVVGDMLVSIVMVLMRFLCSWWFFVRLVCVVLRLVVVCSLLRLFVVLVCMWVVIMLSVVCCSLIVCVSVMRLLLM